MTPNLDTNNISMNETFSENLVKNLDLKTTAKNADVIKNVVRLEFLLVEQHKGFHLRGQPTLYD